MEVEKLDETSVEELYDSVHRLAKKGYYEFAKYVCWYLETRNRTSITANNLAAFYEYEYGEASTESKENRKKIIKLYKRSLKRSKNVKAACSLGLLCYQDKEYKEAIYYYRMALDRKKYPEIMFNLSILYQLEGEYKKSIYYVKQALSGLSETYVYQANVLLCYLYLCNGEVSKAKHRFCLITDSFRELDIDLFYLAYLCEEYSYIDENCFSLIREWKLSEEDAKVIFHTLHLLKKEKIAKYYLKRLLEEAKSNTESITESRPDYTRAYKEIVEQKKELEISKLHIDLILHNPFYHLKKE